MGASSDRGHEIFDKRGHGTEPSVREQPARLVKGSILAVVRGGVGDAAVCPVALAGLAI